MRWTTNKAQHERLRGFARMNLSASLRNPNENWAADRLSKSGLKWKRQATWGCRIFDFWNHEKGIAVEIDGPEHDRAYDSARDQYNYLRSAIVVIRVKNMNEQDMLSALSRIASEVSWKQRRETMGVSGKTKADRISGLKANGIKRASGRWDA